MMNFYRAQIVYVDRIASEVFRMGLAAEGISRDALPGQFYMVRVAEGYDPLLPRPFALHRKQLRYAGSRDGNGMEILFQVVGAGTRLLAQKKVGQEVEMLGPLGQGWRRVGAGSPVLVAGGIGVASLMALVEMMPQGQRKMCRVFLGARSAERIWCVEDFQEFGVTVHTAVEEGIHPFRGTVLDLLRAHWEELRPLSPSLFVCGPLPMAKKAVQWARAEQVPCQISLESAMACGVGVCLGCAIKGALAGSSYLHICRDGPVLDAYEVDWEALGEP